jgi:hypothetical protein
LRDPSCTLGSVHDGKSVYCAMPLNPRPKMVERKYG